MRVGTQALTGHGLAPEVIELVDGEATLKKRPCVDARRGVTLVEDLIATTRLVLAPEEVVEAHLVQGRGRRIRRKMAADAGGPAVRPEDHRHGIPADQPADPALHRLVAREGRLLLRADRVDVAGLCQRRQSHLELAGALEQFVDDESGTCLTLLLDDLVE